MYSREEVKEQLGSLKMLGGEAWINIREADRKKILSYIEESEYISMKEILEMTDISEEDVSKLEDLDLKLINNKITEKAALAERASLQKDIININVKCKKGSDQFLILEAKDLSDNEIK